MRIASHRTYANSLKVVVKRFTAPITNAPGLCLASDGCDAHHVEYVPGRTKPAALGTRRAAAALQTISDIAATFLPL
jgi:hypothetical protein